MAEFKRIVTGMKASKRTGRMTMGSSGKVRLRKRVRCPRTGRKIAITKKG